MSRSAKPDPDWDLHPRLMADSVPVINHGRLQFRLINDRRFIWLLVLPRHAGAEQLHHLPADWREETLAGLDAASHVLDSLYQPTRINVGAIGNLVPQLHVHCIARFVDDPAWPGVVWGAGEREPAEPLELLVRVQPIAAGLAQRLARNSEGTH